MKYQLPKGTYDDLPTEPKPQNGWKQVERWQWLEETIRSVARDYGYKEIRTPIFEETDLFIRGVGDTSDIVTKEMYTFKSKGDQSLTLRPEGTASVIRSFIENGLAQTASLHKFFYIGPFFRYERPQAGRFRQFSQFGIEAFGSPSPEQDFEVIDLLLELCRRLGLKDLKVLLNSIGNLECRTAYKQKLLDYLRPHFGSLSPESQARFEKNPLRILDSKDPKEQALLKEAPLITNHLDAESQEHFQTLLALLKKHQVAFLVEPRLVRGLDYYNRTVFEITSEALGAQNAVGGGGRFDGLMKLLGGPDLPSVGFSAGMERILQTMEGQKVSFPPPAAPTLCLIPIGEEANTKCFSLLFKLRHQNIATEMISGKKVPKALQMANDLRASFAVIIGENELSSQQIEVKNMETRQSHSIKLEELPSFLTQKDTHA